MEKIKEYIFEEVANGKLTKQEAAGMLKELYSDNEANLDQEIAVVGMDCKFPKANNLEEYWQNIRNGACCIDDFPEQRKKDTDLLLQEDYDQDPYQRQGYLDEVDKFGPLFFNITPDEADKMAPAQRLFLESSWKALEDAGLAGGQLEGTKTGVYVGKAHLLEPLYKRFFAEDEDREGVDMLGWTGSVDGLLASRISYYLNLRGPTMIVDTVCSSGLVSTHLACQGLKTGECDVAIAGGVSMILHPLKKDQITMLESPDDVLRPFDKDSNGTVWGEGIASVILKPLDKAIEDRDNIYGVIKGTDINNDGASNGITAPNRDAQEDLLIDLWKDIDFNPEDLTYYEGHGTGTPLGDPIEIQSLTNAVEKFTDQKNFCPMGTVKSNVGHLVGASGVAALIKTMLMLEHREIPPTVNYTEPNPYIDFEEAPVYINTELKEVDEKESPMTIGINSFGISGTNGHLLVEEPPELEREEKIEDRDHIFTLSVKKESLLKDYIESFLEFLTDNQSINLADVCYTATTGRGHYKYRLAVIAEDITELIEKLTKISKLDKIASIPEERIYYGEHKVVVKLTDVDDKTLITKDKRKEIEEQAEVKIDQFINSGKQQSKVLDEIVHYYIRGANLNWNKLYNKAAIKKISLPTYPFEQRRCWVPEDERKTINSKEGC